MELSLTHSKGISNLYSSDSHRLRQQIKCKCSPWYSSLATKSTKSFSGHIWSLNAKQKQNKQMVLCSQKQEIPVLEARSIEEIYDSLAERLLPKVALLAESDNLKSKYIIGLAGPPGAGKTTVASEVVFRLNKLWALKASTQSDDIATVLPMDGFHLYRSQLDVMENPEEAHARRGAPWTFNPELLLKCLHSIRNEGSVYAPSFDHGVGDPVENDVFVSLKHKIVIVEGNYLFLEDGFWKEVCAVFDEKWFVEIDIDTAMERVRKRHIATD
ncbi:putative uridine kinase C227.14 isoform X2 [Asparagus officinalis]|uniref:putative uridine kinase C227.14 isoform X2 n=1 Tax=Asparagus officinalis TaxID=4686 RepID=UPI00098E50D1|nr:putative uridine kinase C227.14 isoform X2 [Asparagus officinalis]